MTTKASKATKREAKELAQEMLMHGLGNVLGYWTENNNGDATRIKEMGYTEDEFGEILQQQADRVAKLLGYEHAWTN